MTLQEGIQSQAARSNGVKGLLVAMVLLEAAAVLVGYHRYDLLSRAGAGLQVPLADAQASDSGAAILAIFHALTFLAAAITWLFWQHRAYGNLLLMGEGKADYSPGWSVGCWFIPFLNLFRPYQMVKELWQRSARGNVKPKLMTLTESGAPGILLLWWGIWLASNFLANLAPRLAAAAKGIQEMQDAASLGVFASLVGLASAVVALQVVRRIDALQREAGATPVSPLEPALA